MSRSFLASKIEFGWLAFGFQPFVFAQVNFCISDAFAHHDVIVFHKREVPITITDHDVLSFVDTLLSLALNGAGFVQGESDTKMTNDLVIASPTLAVIAVHGT